LKKRDENTKVNSDIRPLSNSGSLNLTHSLKSSDEHLILRPSLFSKLTCATFLVMSIILFTGSLYLLFVINDFFASFSLCIGAITLFTLFHFKNSEKEYIFDLNKKVIEISGEEIDFSDIVTIEVLKKTVGANHQPAPFQSGELRLLISDGQRFLLAEGANEEKLSEFAKAIAAQTHSSFFLDTKIHRV